MYVWSSFNQQIALGLTDFGSFTNFLFPAGWTVLEQSSLFYCSSHKPLFCLIYHPCTLNTLIFSRISMTSLCQTTTPIPFVFLQYLRKQRIFSAYNHAISLRVQEVFLFSVPETQPHSNNWYCEQALHKQAERFSLNPARALLWVTAESSPNKNRLCDLCLYHR